MSPQILENAFRRLDFDRELVYKYFVSFSLFEKALKETGFIKPSDNNSANPDWEKFAHSIEDQFSARLNTHENHELMTAVNYLVNHPPRKQIISQTNRLIFDRRPQTPDNSPTVWLSILIRRVRNNLFHGAKFSFDRPRDTLLIQFSLVILEEWANLNRDITRILHEVT